MLSINYCILVFSNVTSEVLIIILSKGDLGIKVEGDEECLSSKCYRRQSLLRLML